MFHTTRRYADRDGGVRKSIYFHDKDSARRLANGMQSVLDYLKQNQARFVTELCEYLRFASVSAQPQHKKDLLACAQWLVAHCQKIGLDARVCETDGHPIVVAK